MRILKATLAIAATVFAFSTIGPATAGGGVGAEGCAEFEGTVCVSPCPEDAEVCIQEGTDETSGDGSETNTETTETTTGSDSAPDAESAESATDADGGDGPEVGTGDSGLVQDSSAVATWQVVLVVLAFAGFGGAGWAALKNRG